MIFLFGTGTSRLVTTPLPTLPCTYCGTQGKLSVTVFSRYFSLFWIPVFPIGKVSVTVCEHCKQTLTSKEPLPEAYRQPVQAIQQQTSTPITNFALLLLLGVGIVLIFLLTQLAPGNKRRAAATFTAPGMLHMAANAGKPAYTLLSANRPALI